MRRRLFLYVLLLPLAYQHATAQAFDTAYTIPQSALRNTTFTCHFLIDSFSKVGDSVHASACLQRIDPYFLIYLACTPGNLDTFFAEYRFTSSAKETYRKRFETIYNTPRSETYKKFVEMFDEDRQTRDKLSMARDSFTTAIFEKRMAHSDSIHFDYLYSYVKKNGWPKPADGGLYTELLAIHDGTEGHWLFYLPIMKKSVLAGQASYNGYGNILNRAVRPTLVDLAKKFKDKAVFDISYILKVDSPTKGKLDLMKKAVYEHKPIKYFYFVYESNNEKDFHKFLSAEGGFCRGLYGWGTSSYWIAWDLMVHLGYYQQDLLHTDSPNVPYNFAFSESSLKRKKLTLYLLY